MCSSIDYHYSGAVYRVTVDLRAFQVSAITTQKMGHLETFASIARRTKPIAAITGGFYDTRSNTPVGDILIDSRLIYDGCVGPVLVVSKKTGITQIVSQAQYNTVDKKVLSFAVQTGPTLVKGGQVSINLKAEGFGCYIVKPARRTAIGLTPAKKLIVVATKSSMSLHQLAAVMIRAGCRSAVSLDGGSSTGLYYKDKMQITPQRGMVCIIVVVRKDIHHELGR
jgi:exopolysaccharide biosynthesis protein